MKNFLPLNLFLGTLIALAAGMLVSDLVAYRLGRLLPATGVQGGKSVPEKEEELAAYAPILEKGLFGRATIGKLTPLARQQAATAPAAAVPIDLVLLGTAMGSFRETFALVRKAQTGEERVVRLGDPVFEAGRLVAVAKESITVSAGGSKRVINAPTAPAAGPSSPPPAAAPSNSLATATGSGSYIIDQRGLNAALDNIGQAMTDARLLPYMKEGKVEGFRASEVKPQGIFGMVGIKNGDILLRLNDFPIDSPERAIQSLASLKGQSRLKLDMIRDGQPASFTYDIR